MNLEFHYWVTGILAKHAGFEPEEAKVIAYSSQYVDDNDMEIKVFDDHIDEIPSYVNNISQTMNILLPRRDLMQIYPIFHFIPGDQSESSPRSDEKKNVLNTTPDSNYARKIMEISLEKAALKFTSGDYESALCRIGICSHSYVDTWSHQNFVGANNDYNSLGGNYIPNVGHADALHYPDWVSHRWTDPRLVEPEINNNLRFMTAARKLYYHYLTYLESINRKTEDDWNQIEGKLLQIFGKTYSGDKNEKTATRFKKYAAEAPYLKKYRADEWLGNGLKVIGSWDSTDRYTERFVWKVPSKKEKSLWYKFQESVKEHVSDSMPVLAPAFEEAGIHI
ncbi:MAG: hypothetical protein IH614_09295 [Desulfuromonadales bacterium]|nr:hypothetical protein [Desulfuromonadales bacterium]